MHVSIILILASPPMVPGISVIWFNGFWLLHNKDHISCRVCKCKSYVFYTPVDVINKSVFLEIIMISATIIVLDILKDPEQ